MLNKMDKSIIFRSHRGVHRVDPWLLVYNTVFLFESSRSLVEDDRLHPVEDGLVQFLLYTFDFQG